MVDGCNFTPSEVAVMKRLERRRSRLPLRIIPPAHTVGLHQALMEFRDRPDIVLDDPPGGALDVAAVEVGMALRLARTKKRMTQKQLSLVSGVPQGAISLIECARGKDGPSYRVLRELANALGLALELRSLHPVREVVPTCLANSVTPESLAFERVIEDADFCWDLVRTCLPHSDFEEIRDRMAISVGALVDTDSEAFFIDAECSYWSVKPNSTAVLELVQDVLVVVMNPSAKVRVPSGDLPPAQYSFARGEVEVQNSTSTVSGIVTVPITASVVDKMSK